MPFNTSLVVQLLNDREQFPWITLAPLEYESELTGETYTVPAYFRTDGASLPASLVAVPVIGPALFLRYFGQGVFQGFKQGVLHDFLRRPDRVTGKTPVPAKVAHLVFKEALTEAGYPDDLVNTYHAAVVAFNS